MSSRNTAEYNDLEAKVLTAVDKYFSNTSALTLGGVAYTPLAFKHVLTDDLHAQAAALAQHGQYRVAVLAARQTRANVRALLKLLRPAIVNMFPKAGVDAVLQDFGFPTAAMHPAKPKVKAKAQAVDKVLATRAARHTMGPKQRKQTLPTPAPATPPPAASK